MKKKLIVGIIIGLALYGLIALIRWDPAATDSTSNNVSITDGVQYIDLTAKAGYSPRQTIAQAGLPTVLRVNTNGTYDCSSSINIPAQGVNQYLPATGTTEIPLGTPATGLLEGTCSMGMYRFEVDFQS